MDIVLINTSWTKSIVAVVVRWLLSVHWQPQAQKFGMAWLKTIGMKNYMKTNMIPPFALFESRV